MVNVSLNHSLALFFNQNAQRETRKEKKMPRTPNKSMYNLVFMPIFHKMKAAVCGLEFSTETLSDNITHISVV